MVIDAGANIAEQLRHVLNLIEQDRRAKFLKERPRVGACAVTHVWILQ
jgi:hypothetical protein